MSRPSQSASDIEQAKRNAATARARVQTSLTAVKQRLNPKALAADAAQTVKSRTSAIGEKATDAARKRPAVVGAAAGVAALILFRKPAGKVFRRLFSRRARLERLDYQYRLQDVRDRRRAEKRARRDAKDARKAEKRARRDAAAAENSNSTQAAPQSAA